jgi:hypothetical protein
MGGQKDMATRFWPILALLAVCFQPALAETRWHFNPESSDELTGEKVAASVSVEDDEKFDRARSVLLITRDASNELVAVIGLSKIDRLPLGRDEVKVSYRADGSEMQKGTGWKKDGVRTMYRKVTPEEAKALFAGDFLIVSLDVTGKRYRYEFDDAEAEKLREAVEKLVE